MATEASSNKEMDALLIETNQPQSHKYQKQLCNKTVWIVSLLILVVAAIVIIVVVVIQNNKSDEASLDNEFSYPIICCNTYDNQLCNRYTDSCSWSDTDEQCDFVNRPSLFEDDLCFSDNNASCPVSELDNDYSSGIPVFEVRDELLQHSENQFPSPPQPEVMQVTEGIYVGIGYDLANTIFIETSSGIVVIDTLSETTSAKKAFNDYRALRVNQTRNESQMFIEAIIITHFHTDHVMAMSFWTFLNVENGFGDDSTPKLYANKGIMNGLQDFMIYARTPRTTRAGKQFGSIMTSDNYFNYSFIQERNLFINAGIGPRLSSSANLTFINPLDDQYFVLLSDDDYILNISDIQLLLVHSPGETDDQISVWYEEKKSLFVGDNIYYAFPNIYAIRGTTPRDPKKWINTLDTFIRKYNNTQYLVGSHTLPISDNVTRELILYRDLIAFLHDQTVRHMTAGLLVDDIIIQVENSRPQVLREGRKQELYGTVEWTVRAIYDLYLGWFAGDASQLYPSTIYERGKGLYLLLKKFYHDSGDGNMIGALVLYLTDILDEAITNYDDVEINYVEVALKEERWILEIITSLSSLYDEYKQCDEWKDLMELRWTIMQNMAGRSVSSNGRNYLISEFLRERFYNTIGSDSDSDSGAVENFILNVYMNWPIEWIVDLLRFRVNPINVQRANETEWITNLKFSDSGKMFNLWLRNGGVICIEEYSMYDQDIIDEFDERASLIYQFPEQLYKLQLLGIQYVIKGTQEDIDAFWSKLDPGL